RPRIPARRPWRRWSRSTRRVIPMPGRSRSTAGRGRTASSTGEPTVSPASWLGPATRRGSAPSSTTFVPGRTWPQRRALRTEPDRGSSKVPPGSHSQWRARRSPEAARLPAGHTRMHSEGAPNVVTTRRVSEPKPAGRAPRIVLRDIETVKEMRLVGELQQRVSRWDEHSAPLVQLIASREVGGILIGAFDGNALVGFVFGFPGYISGRRVLHSHMLAVDPAHRDKDLGFRLKLAQRERALEQGVDQMTWT